MAADRKIILVAAVEQFCGIGMNGQLPWPRIAEDMRHFRELTTAHTPDAVNVVIMGRKTFESIGGRPLKGRINFVVSTTMTTDLARDCFWTVDSLQRAIDLAKAMLRVEKIFIIGGARLFEEGILCADEVSITYVEAGFETDVQLQPSFFKYLQTNFDVEREDKFDITPPIRIFHYIRK